jgi:cytochrome c oxidase assembly protein subunit 15
MADSGEAKERLIVERFMGESNGGGLTGHRDVPVRPRSAFRRVAWAGSLATLALIALGGVVRVTGSGMGCGDDWPLCHGRLIPPLDPPTLIEYAHRLSAVLVSLLVLGLCVLAWTRHRHEPELRRPASWAGGLILFQVLLGAVTVRLELAAAAVVFHLLTAMLLLAALLTAALRARERGRSPAGPVASSRARLLVRACMVAGFIVIALGGLVANLNAGPACQGFPLCNGLLVPEGGAAVGLHWFHRVAAFVLVGLIAATVIVVREGRASSPALRRRALAVLGLTVLQVGVAAAMILSFLPPALRAGHMALGAVVWASLVALAEEASRRGAPEEEPTPERAAHVFAAGPAPRPLQGTVDTVRTR